MFSRDDTIAAIATPPGRGGLGVIRISGPDAPAIAARLLPHRPRLEPRFATLAQIANPTSGRPLDQVVATYFESPASFTGDHVIELSAHGSPAVLREILGAAIAAGARLAEPGEFTLRAYLNGRIDLVQAEAIADLVAATTPLQARAAFDQLDGTLTEAIAAIDNAVFDLAARLEASIDFPDEHYHFVDPQQARDELLGIERELTALLCQAARGRLVREGLRIAIAGTPNVGKSSLFNHLVGTSRAIVAATPGTTRDLVTEAIDIDGLSATLVDTAGLRRASDEIEREGMARARSALGVADLVLVVVDRSRELGADDLDVLRETAARPSVIVVNKLDLPAAWNVDQVQDGRMVLSISLKSGAGLDSLGAAILGVVGADAAPRDVPAVTNLRHVTLLEQARGTLRRAVDALTESNGTLPKSSCWPTCRRHESPWKRSRVGERRTIS